MPSTICAARSPVAVRGRVLVKGDWAFAAAAASNRIGSARMALDHTPDAGRGGCRLLGELSERGLGFPRRDLADVDIAEADLQPWVCSSIGPLATSGWSRSQKLSRWRRRRLLAVEPDPDARADHLDAERVPFPDRVVGLDERPLARVVGVVVPEPARALVGAVADFARIVDVPDLDLRVPRR